MQMSKHRKLRCFVLMPFDDRMQEVYEGVYRPVCDKNDIECWRVDEVAGPGSITRDIVEGILEADLIIADLTGRNPNVFYELGIAHMAGNKTIMTAQMRDDVPFDIANYRVIFYGQSIAGSKRLSEDLDRAIQELLTALDRTNNPVQDVLAGRAVGKGAGKIPLIKVIDLSELPPAVTTYLRQHRIVYTDDVNKMDFEDLIRTDGIGKKSISMLVSKIIAHDLYDDIDYLTEFVLRHRLDASGTRRFF